MDASAGVTSSYSMLHVVTRSIVTTVRGCSMKANQLRIQKLSTNTSCLLSSPGCLFASLQGAAKAQCYYHVVTYMCSRGGVKAHLLVVKCSKV
jgi:hypothetical protein